MAGRGLQHPAGDPYPGQSALAVRPHPWLPNTYTVPFLDGRLVYAVLEGDEMGLVVVLRYEPTPDQGEQPRMQ